MAWRIDKSKAVFSPELTSSDQTKWDAFQNAIHNKHMHPKDAAEAARCDQYKKLTGNQFQIRLSGKMRATFLVDESKEVVTVKQVGGHT
ncbi:MAG: hypothetical protein KJ000_23300 [Pirellulaceae bacterium]|jgi:hypothetical protein|nr:hypothetical protein [Pirellulaceae bacterium]